MQPVILPSARKRGIADEDILHALHQAISEFSDQGDHELTMAIGPARNGVTLLEIGFLHDENGQIVVIHAMNARPKYL